MREATCRVGLVSPRSTWLSIGAETPERSARSRNERSMASRSALTRGPTAATVGSAAAVITSVRYHVQTSALYAPIEHQLRQWCVIFAAPLNGVARVPLAHGVRHMRTVRFSTGPMRTGES